MRTALTRTTAVTGVLVTLLAGTATAAAREPRWTTSQAGRLPEAYLHSVTAPGRDAAWAAGQQTGATGRAHGVVLRWDGARWRRVPAAELPKVNYWYSVSASSPRNVWVYGWSQTGAAVARFDGTRWREVPMPEPPGGGSVSYAELAVVRGATWLAGETWVARRGAGGWETTALPPLVSIKAIDARTAADAWLAGYAVTADGSVQPYTSHWDGEEWTPVPMPGNGMAIQDIWAESPTSVWVTGGAQRGEEAVPAVLHWDGTGWQDVGLPDEGQITLAISGGGGEVWVTGDPEGFEGPPMYWRHDGTGWTTVAGELPAGGRADQMTALAPIRGTDRHWAVGAYTVDEGQVAHMFELIQRSD
ncbi:hypothetical protein ABGB17_28820 [Sphaerisporangium sp. B11E5]|uniref:hypothetical protein n=1 Tax=Sphaerisporangium sp. B11E5 TaxID=3153563 RepID=UPI00325F76BC